MDVGQIAQLVEHGIENARVGGSNPPLPTTFRPFPERVYGAASTMVPRRMPLGDYPPDAVVLGKIASRALLLAVH